MSGVYSPKEAAARLLAAEADFLLAHKWVPLAPAAPGEPVLWRRPLEASGELWIKAVPLRQATALKIVRKGVG